MVSTSLLATSRKPVRLPLVLFDYAEFSVRCKDRKSQINSIDAMRAILNTLRRSPHGYDICTRAARRHRGRPSMAVSR
jgi:hypothetical protein